MLQINFCVPELASELHPHFGILAQNCPLRPSDENGRGGLLSPLQNVFLVFADGPFNCTVPETLCLLSLRALGPGVWILTFAAGLLARMCAGPRYLCLPPHTTDAGQSLLISTGCSSHHHFLSVHFPPFIYKFSQCLHFFGLFFFFF